MGHDLRDDRAGPALLASRGMEAGGGGRSGPGRAPDRLSAARAGSEADPQGAAHSGACSPFAAGIDGGLWRGNEEKRQQLLREAVALGVDYVDLEMDIATKIRRFGKTKRIVSYHNTKTTPVDLEDIAEKCEEFDPDVVKIATAATTLAEASRVLHLGTKAKVPMIPIAMGEIGVFTRILGAKFGAPFTYAGFNPERVFAAGMLPLRRGEKRLTPMMRSTPTPKSMVLLAIRSSRASVRRCITRHSGSSA